MLVEDRPLRAFVAPYHGVGPYHYYEYVALPFTVFKEKYMPGMRKVKAAGAEYYFLPCVLFAQLSEIFEGSICHSVFLPRILIY